MARWVVSPGPMQCCSNPRVRPGGKFCATCGRVAGGAGADGHAKGGGSKDRTEVMDTTDGERTSLLPKPSGKGKDSGDGNSLALKAIVFLCGIATFARTEAVLLQTQFFAQCEEYGPQYFYAIAAALLFVPGPFVIAVVRWLEKGSTTPVATRMFRKVVVANVTSAVALLMLVLEIILFPKESSGAATGYKLAYVYMPILGAGASLHFQAMSQALSFFPTSYLSLLLVGSYCPFVVYVPVNSIGQLCVAEYQEDASVLGVPCKNATRGGHVNAAVILTCNKWETEWTAVWAFFASAILLCLQSIAAAHVLRTNSMARHYMSLADHPDPAEPPSKSGNGGRASGKGSVNRSDSDCENGEGGAKSPAAAAAGSSLPRALAALPQLYSTTCCTMASLLVTSQYGMIPTQGKMMYLTEYLLYEFYICSCLGALAASRWPLGDGSSVVISTLRCFVVPLTYAYEKMHGLPFEITQRSDAAVLGINFVFIVSGAWIFASSFACLQLKLHDRPNDKKWALNWNNGVYFASMIVAFGISIAIGYLVWGADGQGP